MAEPESGADAHLDRRHRRSQRKNARIRRGIALGAAIAVVVGVVLVATDLVRIGGSDTPSIAGTLHQGAGSGAVAANTPSTTTAENCRALSTTDPLKLWVGGDSLAGSLGPSLGAITGSTGVVQPYFDSRVSSGLANPGFFDWPNQATTELADISPDIVVFIIGANDWSAVTGGDTWKADYAKRVEEMVSILAGSGRTVYWVSAPIHRDTNMNDAVVQVNVVAAAVVQRHPNVKFVDAYKLFSDTDGKFALNLPDETGKVVTMRAGDGVHLTTDGGDFLARAVFKLVDAQCRVTAQKVAGVTKETIQTAGSTQVAPSSNSSSGSNSGATVQTTPPATAPPSTTIPVPETTPSTTTLPTTTTTTPSPPPSTP
jgi:hypothetical protein